MRARVGVHVSRAKASARREGGQGSKRSAGGGQADCCPEQRIYNAKKNAALHTAPGC